MKQKKAFKKHRKHLIAFYNYQIKTHGSFKEFQRRLERKDQKRLKLRYLRYQKRQVIAKNDKGQVIWFPMLQKCYLWFRSGQLIQLPKTASEDKLIAYSYLLEPPIRGG